jgi:hypothetical protein
MLSITDIFLGVTWGHAYNITFIADTLSHVSCS